MIYAHDEGHHSPSSGSSGSPPTWPTPTTRSRCARSAERSGAGRTRSAS